MNYKQLTEKKKVEIDILLKKRYSMRKVALKLGIHHSTISRYKRGIYTKYLLFVFTEHGVAMLATIIKTSVAEVISILLHVILKSVYIELNISFYFNIKRS